MCWLSSRNFFRGGGKIYCYANFFCYANFSIVFGPNFRGQKSLGRGKLPQGDALLPPCGRKPVWILKNSTSLLSSLDQLDVRTATSVQTFDFSTLYTSITHLLKSRISNLVHNAFRKKDGSARYIHIEVTRAKGYFTHDINDGGDNLFTADNICKMIEFLIDNIFVKFGGRLFRQVIGILVGTNCAPLLADLFLYSNENEFPDNMIRIGIRRLARSFNPCYRHRYIDDCWLSQQSAFEIYPSQRTVEKANKSDHLANYLDLTFIIDNSGGKSQPGYMTN